MSVRTAMHRATGFISVPRPPIAATSTVDREVVRISLLGVVRADLGEREIVLSGAQPRLILVYLALHRGRPVTAEELAEILWPHGRAQHWDGAVRGVISKVRAYLVEVGTAAPRLDNIGRTYRLVCGDHSSIDIWQAERDLASATAQIAAGNSKGAAAAASRAAAALTNTLLPGHDGDWLDTWRSQLDSMRRRALQLGSRAHTQCGNHDEAIRLACAAVSNDPYNEESHRVLMAAHLAAGNRASALRVYGDCRRVLADDLGVSPSAETEAAYLQLLGPEPAGVAPDARVRRRQPPLLEDRPFVGRDHELAAILSAWELARQGARQIILLHGQVGIGKTRTGSEAIRRMDPTNVLCGRSSEGRVTPFEPFAEAIGRFADHLDDDELGQLIDGFAAEISSLAPSIAARQIIDRNPTADGGDRPTLFDAVGALLTRVAKAPTVLVVDDLHWADPSTLLMLRHCARTLDCARLLLLVSYRDDCPPASPMADMIADLQGLEGCRTTPLGGLCAHDVADLLRATPVANARSAVRLSRFSTMLTGTERPSRRAV